jgi:hypothetical protein
MESKMSVFKLVGAFTLAAGLWHLGNGMVKFTHLDSSAPLADACIRQAQSGQSCTAEQVLAIKEETDVTANILRGGLFLAGAAAFLTHGKRKPPAT